MTSNHQKLLETRNNHWYQFAEGELEHTFACIKQLKEVAWAHDLIQRTEAAIGLMKWFEDNKDKIDKLEWLQNWEKLEDLRTSFFEVRYAFDLYKRGIVPVYEKKTLADSSVDFEITLTDKVFNVELVSTLQTESMSKQTEHISPIAKLVATDPADELRKVQSKIVRKVAKENKKTGTYEPHKFPEPQAGVSMYNVVIADTRGFTAGGHIESYEEVQMVWGCNHYLKAGGQEINGYYIGKQPLAGLFDIEKQGAEAQLFRERIHLLGIVSEKKFGEDQVIQQTHLGAVPLARRLGGGQKWRLLEAG